MNNLLLGLAVLWFSPVPTMALAFVSMALWPMIFSSLKFGFIYGSNHRLKSFDNLAFRAESPFDYWSILTFWSLISAGFFLYAIYLTVSR